MAKDDFDMDFHFDDDDFDPKAFLDGEDGADIDLSEFDDVPSGGDKLDETVADGYDDELDLSGLGLDEDSDETVDELDLDDILSPKAVRRNSQEHDDFGTNKQEDDSDFDGTEFLDDEDDQTQDKIYCRYAGAALGFQLQFLPGRMRAAAFFHAIHSLQSYRR